MSYMAVDPRTSTMPGRSTSGFHRRGRHCLHSGGSNSVPVGSIRLPPVSQKSLAVSWFARTAQVKKYHPVAKTIPLTAGRGSVLSCSVWFSPLPFRPIRFDSVQFGSAMSSQNPCRQLAGVGKNTGNTQVRNENPSSQQQERLRFGQVRFRISVARKVFPGRPRGERVARRAHTLAARRRRRNTRIYSENISPTRI